MGNCLFCQILEGKIPSKKVYEDEDTYAFEDIHPQAKHHVLVICKQHIPDVAHSHQLSDRQLAACLRTCAQVAEELGIRESGYRVVTNCGPDACQSVRHMHFHVLGGRQLTGQMG